MQQAIPMMTASHFIYMCFLQKIYDSVSYQGLPVLAFGNMANQK